MAMHITMIGGGYVGLVSGVCLAAFGTHVTIVEYTPTRLIHLQRGKLPIYEPGLEALLAEQKAAGRLNISNNLEKALATSQAAFIAVGTPTRRGSGHADLSYVYEATRSIAQAASHALLVVTKSTVPVGTGREVAHILHQARPSLNFNVASNPEFLREGNAVRDFMKPDRIIIGLDHKSPDQGAAARTLMTQLYHPIAPEKQIFMGLESAELTKYAANAFLAMKVSFINEMADLCEATQADITEVAYGMGLDPRISPHFLNPGPGYGGSCFPKDTQALATTARQAGTPTALVETTIAANNARKLRLAERILTLTEGEPYTKTIAVLGLTFKANTDDMRDAPALTILPLLHEAGASLRLFDPKGMDQARTLLPKGLFYANTALEALEGADLLLILTEWAEFQQLTPHQIQSRMRGRVILDCRSLWDTQSLKEAGFTYHCLGTAPKT